MEQDRAFRCGFYDAPGSIVEMDGVEVDGFPIGGIINGAKRAHLRNLSINNCAVPLQVIKSTDVSVINTQVDARLVRDIKGDFEVLSIFSDELIISVALKLEAAPKKQRRHLLRRSEIGEQVNLDSAQKWLALANRLARLGETIAKLF